MSGFPPGPLCIIGVKGGVTAMEKPHAMQLAASYCPCHGRGKERETGRGGELCRDVSMTRPCLRLLKLIIQNTRKLLQKYIKRHDSSEPRNKYGITIGIHLL